MKRLWFWLALLPVGLSSCEEEPELAKGDYLIFGSFYGMCRGEGCVATFKLETNRLLEDTTQQLGDYYNFESGYQVLDQAYYEQARKLLTAFPHQLFSEHRRPSVGTVGSDHRLIGLPKIGTVEYSATFGCPDCADQGGLYVEYRRGFAHGVWVIDQYQANVPPYLHEFMDQVNETIRSINGW